MPSQKKPKTKLPFKAKTMGAAQRGIDRSRSRKDVKKSTENTSAVTVFRPDADGNLVEVEAVEPVFAKPTTKKSRPRLPKGSKSLL